MGVVETLFEVDDLVAYNDIDVLPIFKWYNIQLSNIDGNGY